MVKKPEKQPPPPNPPSASPTSSSSASSEEETPPPVKKPDAASITTVLQKHPEPSSTSIGGKEGEEEGSESEYESTDEESSEDSRAAAAIANPPLQPRDSRTADGKQGLNTPLSSDTNSEDGEEDGEEVDSSSESEQQPFPALPQEAQNAEGKKSAAPISGSDSSSEDETESGSDSDTTAPPPRNSSRSTADPSLKPLSSKPMDSPIRPTVKNPITRKRSTTSPSQVSEKKRKTADIVGAEGVKDKKEIIRRIWSKEDELTLLQCILDFNEQHLGKSTQVQAAPLLKFVNRSLSSSVTPTQMNEKIRRLKQKYNAIFKQVGDANNPSISNAHDAAFFDLSRKLWGPVKEEPVFTEKNCKPDKVKETIKGVKGKSNYLAAEYPFLRWHAKNDHANNALVVQSHIPTVEAKDLEGSCKKLEITEIQLHMKKTMLLSSSLKLIEDALGKF